MAALINSSLAGSRSGSVNVPSTPPSRTITPGFAPRTRYCDTAPVSTSRRLDELRCDADAAIRAPGIRSDQVRTPVVHTVNDDANPQILTRPVPGPRPAGLDRHRGGISRLELAPHDSPPQLTRLLAGTAGSAPRSAINRLLLLPKRGSCLDDDHRKHQQRVCEDAAEHDARGHDS